MRIALFTETFLPKIEGIVTRLMVRRVVTEPNTCRALRMKAREQAEQWSWAEATKQLVRFYDEAIRSPRYSKPEHASAPWMLAMKRAAIGGKKIFLS